MKKITLIIGIILAVMLTMSVTSCEKKQGAAGTGTGAQTGTQSPEGGASSEAQMGMAQSTIDVNTASATELQQVPGIDQTLAQNIVSYRDANGPFSSVDDLSKVQGMDQQKLDSLKNYLTVGQSPGTSGSSGMEGMESGGSSGTSGSSGAEGMDSGGSSSGSSGY